MKTYHKIQSVYKRTLDGKTYSKKVIEGEWVKEEFEYLRNNLWYWQEKIDGTNIRIEFDGDKIDFKGRTDKAIIPYFLLEILKKEFSPKLNLFKDLFVTKDNNLEVILFGGGYGNKIQKIGSKYRPDNGFVLFDININGIWLKKEAVYNIGKKLNLDIVPFYGILSLIDAIEEVKKGINSKYNKDLIAEGLVGVPLISLNDRLGKRIITKIKTTDF